MTLKAYPESLKFLKNNHLKIYSSSAWGERGFCGVCGTNLFWQSKDKKYFSINTFASVEPIHDLNLTTEIFIDHKPDFYALNNATKQFTEQDVVTMFNSSSKK